MAGIDKYEGVEATVKDTGTLLRPNSLWVEVNGKTLRVWAENAVPCAAKLETVTEAETATEAIDLSA